MENIASVVTESPNEEKKESGDIIDPEDREKPASLPEKDEKPAENIQADTFDEESLSQTEYTRASETPEADRLISQGVSFFNGLVQTLKSPEATRRLAESLIEENKETGKTTLRIPVPDKESVINFLTLAGYFCFYPQNATNLQKMLQFFLQKRRFTIDSLVIIEE